MQPPDSIESHRWLGFYRDFFLLDPSWMPEKQTRVRSGGPLVAGSLDYCRL